LGHRPTIRISKKFLSAPIHPTLVAGFGPSSLISDIENIMVFLLLPLMKQHQAYNFYVTQTKIPSLSYISIDIYFEMEAPFVRRNKELMQQKDTIRHAYLKCKEVNSLMRMEDIRIKCSAVWCKVILFWYACATMTVSPCASAGLRSVVVLILLRGHVLCQIKCSDFISR